MHILIFQNNSIVISLRSLVGTEKSLKPMIPAYLFYTKHTSEYIYFPRSKNDEEEILGRAVTVEYGGNEIVADEMEKKREKIKESYKLMKRNVVILYNPLYDVKELYIRIACEIANKLEEVESRLAQVLIDKLRDGAY